jgi:C_GCAxxG_C_C family probable redox protein
MTPFDKDLPNYSRLAKRLLFTTFNCAKAQVIPLQAMYGIENNALIMGLTGLAGGILNNGSTCGVALGAAIGEAMLRDEAFSGKWTPAEEARLLEVIREDIFWFRREFKTTLCREREDVPYERITVLGLLHPQKAKGCVARTGARMDRFVEEYLERRSLPSPLPPDAATSTRQARHCASFILREIREQTGVGDEKMERIAVALDGGVGLTGGGCGALSGALMALGLKYALDPSKTDPEKLKNIYRAMDSLFFHKAKKLVSRFLSRFGYMECSRLTGRTFENWEEFCAFRETSACDAIHAFLIEESVAIIREGE